MHNPSLSTNQSLKGFGSILLLGAATVIFGFTGCVSSKATSKTILIDSDPTGVRVEVNGEDLGKTPTSYVVKADSKGDFKGAWNDSPIVSFVAYPPEGVDGLYKQTKSFTPSSFAETGDRVPEKIFFDLHRPGGR